MKVARPVFWMVSLWMGGALAQEPASFVRGVPIEITQEGPFQRFTLPLEVYRTVQSADLGDVRVFNARGESVPHAVLRAGRWELDSSPRAELPIFPLPDETDPTEPALGIDELVLGATSDTEEALEGEVAETTLTSTIRLREESPPNAYLLDASEIALPIRALLLTWRDAERGFVTTVTVESSDDLELYEGWGTNERIFSLRNGDRALQRNLIELPQRRVSYIRLSLPEGNIEAELARAEAVLVSPPDESGRWFRAEGLEGSEASDYRFDTGGMVPVDAARLSLPQENSVARAELLSAPAPSGSWLTQFEGLVYRLAFPGETLSSAPLIFEPSQDRYWRVEVAAAGGGFGEGVLGLELHAPPETLLFVPRGDPPFLLAYGALGVELAAFEADALLELVPDFASVPEAQLGSPRELGGEAVLNPATPLIRRLGPPVAVTVATGLLILVVVLRRRRVSEAEVGSG